MMSFITKLDLYQAHDDLNLSRQQNHLGDSNNFLKEDCSHIDDKLAGINNKICLSNFVGSSFLKNINHLLNIAPTSLKHGYTASGQSECVDKIVKSIWHKDKGGQQLVSFEGHHFGTGSFLSRAFHLRGDYFFPAQFYPTQQKKI